MYMIYIHKISRFVTLIFTLNCKLYHSFTNQEPKYFREFALDQRKPICEVFLSGLGTVYEMIKNFHNSSKFQVKFGKHFEYLYEECPKSKVHDVIKRVECEGETCTQ